MFSHRSNSKPHRSKKRRHVGTLPPVNMFKRFPELASPISPSVGSWLGWHLEALTVRLDNACFYCETGFCFKISTLSSGDSHRHSQAHLVLPILTARWVNTRDQAQLPSLALPKALGGHKQVTLPLGASVVCKMGVLGPTLVDSCED